MVDHKKICEAFKKLRAKKKISLKEFSEFTGLSVYKLRKIESGTFIIRMNHLIILSRCMKRKVYLILKDLERQSD